MLFASFTAAELFLLLQHELLLFAAAFFALGMIDEFALDCTYLWCRITGRIRTPRIDERELDQLEGLAGPAAVFIPTWQEAEVIGSDLPLLATGRFLAAPRLERFVSRNVNESLDFVNTGRPPTR